MSDIPNSVWNETDASNTTAAPDGAPEGMAPSGVNDVLRAHQGAIKRWYDWSVPKTTAGTSTAYTLSYSVAPGALVDGMSHVVLFNAINGAAPTLNVNSLGATPLHAYVNGAWAAVPTGFIGANAVYSVTYNSGAGAYRILEPPSEVILGVSVQTAGSGFDFPSVPSNVNHIRLVCEGIVGTDAAQMGLRTYGADGVLDVGSSDYVSWGQTIPSDTGTATGSGAATTSYMALTGAVDSSTNFGFTCFAEANNIQASRYTMFDVRSTYGDSAGVVAVRFLGSGERVEADRITGVKVIVSSGTFTGRATLYGSI